MSRRPRNALAGLGLAAAGMVYRRFSGRKQAVEPAPPAPPPDAVDDAAVAQARSELAEELARRAGRSDA